MHLHLNFREVVHSLLSKRPSAQEIAQKTHAEDQAFITAQPWDFYIKTRSGASFYLPQQNASNLERLLQAFSRQDVPFTIRSSRELKYRDQQVIVVTLDSKGGNWINKALERAADARKAATPMSAVE